MSFIDLMNHSSFDCGAILLSLTCLVYNIIQKHTDKPQNRLYMLALANIIITAVCNLVLVVAEPNQYLDYHSRVLADTFTYLYFLLHTALPVLMFYYALYATHSLDRVKKKGRIILFVPFAVTELLVLTNPLTHAVYYYNDALEFTRNNGELVIYAVAAFYSFLCFYYFMRHWYGISGKRKRILVYSLICTMAGLLVQFFMKGVQTELFGESVTLFGIMLAVEYNEDRVDIETGVNNRKAFLLDMASYFDADVKLYLTTVRLTNLERDKRIINASGDEALIEIVGLYLKTVYPRYMTYHVTPETFALVLIGQDEEERDLQAERISKQFMEGFRLNERDVHIQGMILCAETGPSLQSVEDALLLCETPIPNKENGKILKGEDLSFLHYNAKLEHVLRRAIAQHRFMVYYQPVYDLKEMRIASAESSIRLHDEELGELHPVDFITAAERIGIIDELGDYVLREVCSFLHSGVPSDKGIRFININLSLVQCMRNDFIDNILGIVKEFRVSPSRINFEITENVAAEDYALVSRIGQGLRAHGFRFSLTGYGTGYSNIYSIFSMEFDIIKLDKSLLEETNRSDKGWVVLKNTIDMIHTLDRKVTIVGAETKDQVEKMRELSVDWVQGYYFSRPLTPEKIAEL
jgi:EAL domain-containing protein (putative c-di-GMP-specific phosphodiesterase class I)/GGDEF domain-containing protein